MLDGGESTCAILHRFQDGHDPFFTDKIEYFRYFTYIAVVFFHKNSCKKKLSKYNKLDLSIKYTLKKSIIFFTYVIMSSLMKLTSENFTETIRSGLTLVDFWAEWCGPCRMMLPILEDFADNAPEGVTVAKLNVDEAQNIAAQFRIMSIPTLLLFKDGEVVDNRVGVQSEDELRKMIQEHQ